jgi:hypothetical protein
MRDIAIVFLAIATIGSVYWLMIRPVLRQRAELKPIYDRIDAAEVQFFTVTAGYVEGLKTILLARLLMISGLLIPALEFLHVLDLSNYMSPGKSLMVMFGIGMLLEFLRKKTQAPVSGNADIGPAPTQDSDI